MRTLSIVYTIALTFLLLVKDPLRLTGGKTAALACVLPVAHLLSFAVLAVLALTPRWPLSRWTVVLILVVYSGCTEIAQWLMGWRTPEWVDFGQDLAGIAAGISAWWGYEVVHDRTRPGSEGSSRPACGPENTPDDL